MNSRTEEAPAGQGPALEDDLLHWVCCDDDTAICGLDVANEPWSSGGPMCPLCVLADEEACPACGE